MLNKSEKSPDEALGAGFGRVVLFEVV